MEDDENEPETQTTITKGPSGHSQILHVRQDSATEMEHLFNAVMNPNYKSKSLPMKLRKLPKSFFQQPDRPRHPPMHSHSRSMGGLVSSVKSSVNHSRSSSTDSSASHASGLNLSSNNLHQQSSMHGTPTNMGQRPGNFTPGPNQHHGFNTQGHMGLQVPQIAHSRSKSSPASLRITQVNPIEVPPDMPLPPGWELAKTADGQAYFMNHTNRTTTWVDPRIAVIKEQQEQHANAGNLQPPQNHPPQQAQMHVNNVHQNEPLPPRWEQAATPQGEIYFINHDTRTTSWLDPRQQGLAMQSSGQTQINAQLQQQLHKMNQLEIGQSYNQPRNMGSQMIIKQLAKEKEMMKLRQREMLKQQVTTTGMDPFLGSSPSPYHEREPSRDSGMGSNFNLPRSSEDYLGNVEDMETESPNPNQQMLNQQQGCMGNVQQARQQQVQHPQHPNTQQQQHFPDFLDTLPASSVDFNGGVGNQGSTALDGDELVPSISDTLSPDFMNDVESMLSPVVKSENMENMTWL